MAYWRLYYHVVWTTKNRLPLITPRIEARLHDLIAGRCRHEKGRVYAVNGMEEHIHVVVSIPPTVLITSFIQKVKGSSSHFIGAELGMPFKWQPGYGIFSVGPQGLKMVTEYVKRQKEHHASGNLFRALEFSTNKDNGPQDPPIPGL